MLSKPSFVVRGSSCKTPPLSTSYIYDPCCFWSCTICIHIYHGALFNTTFHALPPYHWWRRIQLMAAHWRTASPCVQFTAHAPLLGVCFTQHHSPLNCVALGIKRRFHTHGYKYVNVIANGGGGSFFAPNSHSHSHSHWSFHGSIKLPHSHSCSHSHWNSDIRKHHTMFTCFSNFRRIRIRIPHTVCMEY